MSVSLPLFRLLQTLKNKVELNLFKLPYHSQLSVSQSRSSSQLLTGQSKFSGPRKFTLRHKKFEIAGLEM